MSPILSALKAGHWQVLPTSILCLPTELCVAPSAGHCSALHCSGCCTVKALLQRIWTCCSTILEKSKLE